MANLLEQFGIKEVADVTLYRIDTVDGVVTETPALFFDTLKISTIEQTAEQAEARGGKGNPPLIIWDYGKEITVTLQDALFSPASMAVMYGADTDKVNNYEAITEITKMKKITVETTTSVTSGVPSGKSGVLWYVEGTDVKAPLVLASGQISAGTVVYEQRTYSGEGVTGHKIQIDAEHFPGTYKLVGDTLARNRNGEDEYFQFIIHRAKMSAENTITLEAEGDPSVFDMTMRVLRPDDGKPMMELIQYNLPDADTLSLNSVSTFSVAKTASTKSSSLS